MNDIVKVNMAEISGNEVNSVNARELWEYLESKTQFADWIKSRIEKFGFTEGEDYILVSEKNETNNGYKKDYIITIDMAKELAMVENNEKGRVVRKYFINVEKQFYSQKYSLPKTYKDALLELVQKMDEIEMLEKTKAYISDKKTATALNTASQAVKKANKLEIELDKSKEYCTIKRMKMLTHGQDFSFRILRGTANEMGADSIDVFDQNYGTVKAYHRDVWLEAYGLDLYELTA